MPDVADVAARDRGAERFVTIAVIAVGGPAHVRRCLHHLAGQIGGLPVEVVVPIDQAVGDLGGLRAAYPEVRFLDLGTIPTEAAAGSVAAQHELFDRRITAVFSAACGSHVALLQDWGAPGPGWCERVVEAARLPYAAIGGAVDNAGTGILNWAVYFLDFGRHQSPVPAGPTRFLSDVNVVYSRADLEQVRPAWERRYNEVLVNWALLDRGKVLWRQPDMIVLHDRGTLSLGPLLRERLSWGRLFGAARAAVLPGPRILPYILLSPLIPVVIAGRTAVRIVRGGRNRLRFVWAFPAFLLLTIAWTLGEVHGYVTRRAG